MKIEDVDKAVQLKDCIYELSRESKLLKKQMACEESIVVHVNDESFHLHDEEKDAVLKIMIRHRNAAIQKCAREIKAL